MTSAVRVLVEGRVQGVGFRAWTRREALRLGVRGSAVNRPDGRVEIHAEAGDTDALVALLRSGATPGSVASVEVTQVDATGAVTFEVG